MEKGILVASDYKLEWLLPWWWKHYSSHNSYPVVFIDFGMSEEGIAWCKERGIYFLPPPVPYSISSKTHLSLQKRKSWEAAYGEEEIWSVRAAWLKKPLALFHSPFLYGIWLDLDCRIQGDLDPLFNYLSLGTQIALAKEAAPSQFSLPGEVFYSAAVTAFRRGSPFLQKYLETIFELEAELPTDQEIVSRAIFLHQPSFVELSPIYNWNHNLGHNPHAVIQHFCGGLGKIAILNSLAPADFSGIGIPKKWKC